MRGVIERFPVGSGPDTRTEEALDELLQATVRILGAPVMSPDNQTPVADRHGRAIQVPYIVDARGLEVHIGDAVDHPEWVMSAEEDPSFGSKRPSGTREALESNA